MTPVNMCLFFLQFLPLCEAISSRAVIGIVAGWTGVGGEVGRRKRFWSQLKINNFKRSEMGRICVSNTNRNPSNLAVENHPFHITAKRFQIGYSACVSVELTVPIDLSRSPTTCNLSNRGVRKVPLFSEIVAKRLAIEEVSRKHISEHMGWL